jgi:CheY-like chemotaxis protein/anti-sigma regulatory factor (Ser/Thr protein kinase)
VALGPFLEDLGRELAPVAAAAGLRLRVAPTSLAVETDPALLRSIVQNLVGNALRYTERGGVLVGARRRGSRVRIEVWDTGPGLDADERRRVFEAWQRGTSAGRDARGTGLGLAIVERLSALLGHTLDVASTPGRGSVFSIEVPRSATLAQAEIRAAGAAALPAARVLVIDDDPPVRRSLCALLESWGLEVAGAADAAEAVDVAGRGPAPAVILADLRLAAGASGVDAVARVREALGRDVPAALVTAESHEEARAAGRQAGLLVLAKPVEPVRLRAALLHLLRSAA